MSSRHNKIIQYVTPVSRLDNVLVAPNWRHDAVFNPNRYKLKEFAHKDAVDHSTCLRRFVFLGLPYDVNYKMSQGTKEIFDSLSEESKPLFLAIWNRHFKRKKVRKIVVKTDNTIFNKHPVWNVENVKYINDKFLRELILHYSNYKYNKHIAYALELGRSASYNEIFKFIGYCFFARIPDQEIAVRWRIPVKHVEAIRAIFFDFSFFPEDRLATFAYLRQLVNNGLFSDVDFVYYKRVYDMGAIGLKAQTDFYNLTDHEKKEVESFLGKSIIANALNLNFSIKTQKDAVEYGTVVSTLANYYIKNVERQYFESKIKNLDACTRRIEGDLSSNTTGMSDIDLKYMDILLEHSLHDEKIENKTLDMLK